jgi:prepilin-type N-terminal cleavage/methylation domain-containing protein
MEPDMIRVQSDRQPLSAPRASGFTLIEMLVVLAIAGILVSLTAAAAFQVMVYQRVSNTETLIRSLDKALQQQWKAVILRANTENIPASVMTLAGGDQRRARVIWIKLRLKQEFPMNFHEALQPNQAAGGVAIIPGADLPALPAYKAAYHNAYQAALANAGLSTALADRVADPPQNPESGNVPSPPATQGAPLVGESCALLLMALQQGREGALFSTDSLPPGAVQEADYFPNVNTAGIANQKLKNLKLSFPQFADSWAMPLAFYRWPTGNAELNAMCPAPAGTAGNTFRDPGDPEGLLLNQTWYSQAGPNFENICHAVSLSGQQLAFYMQPTIASRGKDNLLGLTWPASSLAPDPMAGDGTRNDSDNIYSYRLREQGRGD